MSAETSDDEGISGGKVRSNLCDIIGDDLSAGEGIFRIINARGTRRGSKGYEFGMLIKLAMPTRRSTTKQGNRVGKNSM